MSTFQPPQYQGGLSSQMAMQPNVNQGPPPSPVKGLGFVSGAPGGAGSGLNGYVGERPAQREEPQSSQSFRQNTNFASPDPALSQAAFTQSQFTTNVSAAAMQSQAMRASTGVEQESVTTEDKRRANLARYKESMAGGGARGRGSTVTAHPSLSAAVSRSRGQGDCAGGSCPMPSRQVAASRPLVSSSSPANNAASLGQTETFVAYTVSDAGSMFKSFTGTTGWFRMVHLIVPPGKRAKRVHVATMATASPATNADPTAGGLADNSYGLRLVAAGTSTAAGSTLFTKFDCENTSAFQVFTMDLSDSPAVDGGLLEIQGKLGTSTNTLLVSSAIVEF